MERVSLLLFHLPQFFDDVGLETLLQPVDTNSSSLIDSSNSAEFKQVVYGSIWGSFSGRRFVIASVDQQVADQFNLPVDPNSVIGDHEVQTATGAKRKKEPIAEVRKRKYIKALSIVDYESFNEQVEALEKLVLSHGNDEEGAAEGESQELDEDANLADLLTHQEGQKQSAEERKASINAKRKRSLAAARAQRALQTGGGGAPIGICYSPINYEDVDIYHGGAKSNVWKERAEDDHKARQRKRPDEYLPQGDMSIFDEDPVDGSGSPAGGATKPSADEPSKRAELKAQAAAQGYGADQCKKCGSRSHLSRHCPGPGKPGYGENSDAPAASSQTVETPVASAPAVVPAAPAQQYGPDQCKKCGSYDHLSRRCPGPQAGGATTAPVAQEATPVPAPTPKRNPAFTGDCCKKCGSTEHLSRHCTGASPVVKTEAPAATPVTKKVDATPPVVRGPKQPAPKSQLEQRPSKQISGDLCKKCGSDQHLSRHCPGATQSAPTQAAQAPSAPVQAAPSATPKVQPPIHIKSRGGGDACRHCESTEHLTRQCPNKGK